MLFLAIDLGSTNTKAALYDERMNRLATKSVPVEYLRADGFVEFDAEAYTDGSVDFGSVPPTRQQLETLARVVAVLCRGLDLPIDDDYVMTHAEAAVLDDYGPATTFERWDLWKLASADGTLQDGGALIRSKAKACCQW